MLAMQHRFDVIMLAQWDMQWKFCTALGISLIDIDCKLLTLQAKYAFCHLVMK
jgi:hypothetical protein